ncbi:MAG: GTPase, partial [Ancrocorticia sp.]|uniref:GTPase n=1 Tax=Ancrocorticia sp. TaxID=2593684 RepID=UPI003F911695
MNTLTLPEAILCLENALGAASGHLDDDLVAAGQNLLVKVRGRRAEGTEHTVVAFAGATGSGKSSLMNAVVGEKLAHVTARRPTTSSALAVTGVPVTALTRWLGIEQTATSTNLPSTGNSQLVLVDLPDIDSTEYAHRRVAKDVLARADLIVWVVDPQKYADSVWHDDYLSEYRRHGATNLVAFNQTDRLGPHELPDVLSHMEELFALESFEGRVIPTSALTGRGIRELQEAIGHVHDSKQAAVRRLAADLRSQAESIAKAVESEDGTVQVPEPLAAFTHVSDAVLASSGSNQLADAAAVSYRERGKRRVDWVGTAWLHSGADPLGGDLSVEEKVAPQERQLAIARASVHRYSSEAAANLPRRWRRDVVTDSEKSAGDLARQSASLVADVNLGQKNPFWWYLALIFQWLMGAVALAGLAWLIVLWVSAAFHIQFPEPPALGPVALPTVLLGVGLAAGVLGALIGRALLA